MTQFIIGVVLGSVLTAGVVVGGNLYDQQRNWLLQEQNSILRQQQLQQHRQQWQQPRRVIPRLAPLSPC